MVHAKKKKKPRSRSLAGTKAGEELARARARRRGKVAVFEGGPEKTITEKTPAEIEGQRRFDISEEQKRLETERDKPEEGEEEAPLLPPKTDVEVLEAGQRVVLEGVAHDEFGNPIPALSETLEEAEERRKQEFQNIGQVALLAAGVGPKAVGTGIRVLKTAKDTIRIAGKEVKRFPLTNDEMITYGKQVIKAEKQRKGKFGKFGIGGTVLAALWATNEFILSPSELATWAAVDNIAGMTSFQIKTIVDGVQFTSADPDVAQERIDEAKQTIAAAKSYVNLATMLNPKMWGPRKQMLTAIDVAEIGILDHEKRLNQLKGGR